MATPPSIALRYQRSEMELKAALSPAGQACLADARGPQDLFAALTLLPDARDSVHALALILPHRQVVWWACLAARLLPDLGQRGPDLAAVEQAEAWVQSAAPQDAERAAELANSCNLDRAPGWAAMAAGWSGPSLAPRGLQAVPPAPHLPGIAARTALILLLYEPTLARRLDMADLREIGIALMQGDLGRKAQAAVAERLRQAA